MIYLIGAGMGSSACFTIEAKKAIEKSTLIIGSERITEPYKADKIIFSEYRPEKIIQIINKNQDKDISVLFSGDSGFYSGAKKLSPMLADYDFKMIPGISSVSYFCSRLGISYDDIFITSLHGRKNNIIQHIRRNKKVFSLLSGNDDIRMICQKLKKYKMNVTINLGTRLSYADERIFTFMSDEADKFDFDMPAVIIAENPNPWDLSLCAISDDDFIRGNVPMTKSEIRTLSAAKLGIKKDSVIYDVGAGTGSMSVEMALRAFEGTVYSIEKNKEALFLLEKNKEKFIADNIEIIEGTAPEAMEKLPAPTHIFIGGASGRIENIIKSAKNKNKNVRIVANAVSLNTVSEIINMSEKDGLDMEVTQVGISKSQKSGGHLIMKANNPIYVFLIN